MESLKRGDEDAENEVESLKRVDEDAENEVESLKRGDGNLKTREISENEKEI